MKISLVALALVVSGFISPTYAKEEPHPWTDPRLVEVKFASGDESQVQKGFFTLWLSERNIGVQFSGPGGIQGRSRPLVDARERAARALKLLQPLVQPKILPGSPGSFVTVTYRDGQRLITKYFPRDSVPSEIMSALLIMGFSDEDGSALKAFRPLVGKKPEQATEPAR